MVDVGGKVWNRREVVAGAATLAVGMALSRAPGARAWAQMPVPEPMEDDRIVCVSTTAATPWQKGKLFRPTFSWEMLDLNIAPDAPRSEKIEGFGACFSELGWTSLAALGEQDRDSVMRELFDPLAGARLTYCRMPIGANDFATEAYSYDETDGDFALAHFSIEHDRQTLIPFIQAAKRYQPELRLWASPWSPPSWMKRNHFYAEAPGVLGVKENGIRPEQVGHEGEDMFIQEPRYLEAYARYFGHFIDAYGAEGIRVGMVMPQNEFNSAQTFPSCTWTPEGLARFVGYLGPEMQRRKVRIFFGTLERGNPKLFKAVIEDRAAGRFIEGLGAQWAGKNAVPALHQEYPALVVYQSEQECGDGRNSWEYAGYGWQLMKHYFREGARAWMYWNISLARGGVSTWGWAQNSLVTVDVPAGSFRYNNDYYMLKHLTHFVEVGARRVETTGTCDDSLAFVNPDGAVVALLRNPHAGAQLVQVQAQGRALAVELPADSMTTMKIRSA